MGSSSSKPNGNEALLLCKDRVRYIKQAIDARFALSAAHLSYIESLRNVGTALRQFAEAEIVAESSLSTSEVDKSPTRSSYASPSPSHIAEHVGSPSLSGSPLSPRLSNMSFMRATRGSAVTVTVGSAATHFVEDDSLTFPLPPPPLPPEIGSSWDYFFDPTDAAGNGGGSQNGESSIRLNFSRFMGLRQLKEAEVVPLVEEEVVKFSDKEKEVTLDKAGLDGGDGYSRTVDLVQTPRQETTGLRPGYDPVNGSVDAFTRIASSELCRSNVEKEEQEKELCAEREDASEFITHRAKDFLSSMKEIEHRFLRAAEAGNEVSRMLETNRIRLSVYSEMIGKQPASAPRYLSAFQQVCCKGDIVFKHESALHMTKVITWNRSISSLSSSSKAPIMSAIKDDSGDSGSDFIEEFSMISGSHSSTLDRLYAWESKLCDEVKASESIRKAYDQKCAQLRHQFARDLKTQVIDKTRAAVKDLHSRVMIAIQSVDSISKRIEKLRDEELQPQLVELIQGLIRMWKAMIECHHAQFITISLAYQGKSSTAPQSESYRQALMQLQSKLECFGSSFANWVNAITSYIDALNTWLQKCVLQPQERRKARKALFPPRQALSPPIFVLCKVWLSGLESLPSEELRDSVRGLVSVLRDSFRQDMEEKQTEKRSGDLDNGELQNNIGEKQRSSNLDGLQTSLTRLFDRLKKFSEASLKVHEDVKQAIETARLEYANGEIR